MSSSAFDKAFEDGVAPGPDRLLPGVVLAAAGLQDDQSMLRTFGSISTDSSAEPVQPDQMMWIASCTKLFTTIAVLQCVERGLFALDSEDDLERLVTQTRNKEILVGFEEGSGKPQLKPASKRNTVRLLLTHASGYGYDFLPPLLTYQESVAKSPVTAPLEATSQREHTFFGLPLVFEPGQGWTYGSGLDVAGRVVENATKTRLGEYMAENIFKPLGMSSTHFSIGSDQSLMQRLMPLTVRPKLDDLLSTGKLPYSKTNEEHYGGGGLFSCATDYIKPLKSLLRNDGKLLKPQTVDSMFEPQLHDTAALEASFAHPLLASIFAPGYPVGIKIWNHGLGGRLLTRDVPGRHCKGTLAWGGMPNLQWWIDRTAGTCGCFFTQLMPAGETKHQRLAVLFEEEVYQRFGRKKTSSS